MQKIICSLAFMFLFMSCLDTKSKEKKKQSELTATEIMEKAHVKAGGDFWRRPKSLTLKGYGIFYRDGKPSKHEKHNMWRVFEDEKQDAQAADGNVRIESFKEGKPVFMVSFDGQNTYDLGGKQEQSAADNRWASNFGYGAIRHALDDGYTLEKMPDDTIFTKPAYRIKVKDVTGGETFFGIDKEDFKIIKVAFDTPRGWHHRLYSDFFSKDSYSWLQSGKVALYYDDVLANEIIWEDFEVNEVLPDSLFQIKPIVIK